MPEAGGLPWGPVGFFLGAEGVLAQETSGEWLERGEGTTPCWVMGTVPSLELERCHLGSNAGNGMVVPGVHPETVSLPPPL